MPVPAPDPLDLVPDPAVIHDRIRATVRTERILRKLLSVSILVRQEREAANAVTPDHSAGPAGVERA